ncbi:Hypothetical_protein [Hexamita inflata]|uniref:Hypothetical_protein n=1 Tax=Hexamita inflata TaxID=28002 RepID=A0AA86UDN1_9EUKA|nr:Hypothetical protein HINF_LOCUS12351 [Hexamita inflata]CAI9951549.1 Hypothetical protein HINF_LOCUS39194 [Hexamita inflata]
MKAKQKIQQSSKDQHQQFLDKYLQQSNKQKFSKLELEQLEQLLDVLTKAMNQEQKVGGDFQLISEQIKNISDSLKGSCKLSEILNSKSEISLTNQYGLKVKVQLQIDNIRGSLLSQKQLDALVQQQTQQKQMALMFLSKIQGVTNIQSTLNDQIIPSYDIQHILNTNKLQQKSVQKQIRDNTQVSSKDEISVINKKIEQQFVQQNLSTLQSSQTQQRSKVETKIDEPEKKVPVKTKKIIKLIFKQQDTKNKQILLSTESKNGFKTQIQFQTEYKSILNDNQNIEMSNFKQTDVKYLNIKQTQSQSQINHKIEIQIETVKSVTKKINRQVKNNINEQPEVNITKQMKIKQKETNTAQKEPKKEQVVKEECIQEPIIKKVQQQKTKEPHKTEKEMQPKIKENITESAQNIIQGKSKGIKVYRKLKTAKTELPDQNKLKLSQNTPQIQKSQSIHKIEQRVVAKRSKSFKHREKCQKHNKEISIQIEPNKQEIKQVINHKQPNTNYSDDKILHTPKQKKSSVKIDRNLSFSPQLSNSQDFSKLNRQQQELAKIKKIEQQLHDYDNLTEIDRQIHKKPLKIQIHQIEDDTSEADLYFQLEQYYQKLEDSIKNQETNSDPRYIAIPLYSLLKNCKNVFKRLNTLLEQQKVIKSKYLEQFHFVIEQFQQANEYKKLLINRADEIESKLYTFQKYVMYIASTDRDQAIINQQVEHSNLYLNLLQNTILSQKRSKFNIDSIREAIQVETEFLDMIKFATYQEFIQIKDKYNKMKASIQIEL